MLSKVVDIAIAERIGHFLVMNKRQTALVDLELTKMFRKRNNKENSFCSREVSVTLIPCGEKRRRIFPCNQFKHIEPVHSFSPFKIQNLS